MLPGLPRTGRLRPVIPPDMPTACPACGSRDGYDFAPVLWPELTEAWGLDADQVRTLDVRDAVRCRACRTQLRNMTLARAVLVALDLPEPFARIWRRRPLLRLLELNECGTLRRMVRRRKLPRKVSGDFPAVDMQALPYADDTFDLVMHGDTLEHVPDPVRGLAECRRVLKPGGALCYTVPVVTGRPTRRRDGLPPSYHGRAVDPVYLVHTEYGDDCWEQPFEAGFTSVDLVAMCYPSSFALICR